MYVKHHISDIQNIQYLLVDLAFTKDNVWLPPSYWQFTIFYLSRTSVYPQYFQFLKGLTSSLIKIVFNIDIFTPFFSSSVTFNFRLLY
jgi:hypothetical protein